VNPWLASEEMLTVSGKGHSHDRYFLEILASTAGLLTGAAHRPGNSGIVSWGPEHVLGKEAMSTRAPDLLAFVATRARSSPLFSVLFRAKISGRVL
jgi:hypothetical protein